MTDSISIQVLRSSDHDRWRSILPARRSVFGSVEFASIIEQYMAYTGRLFVFSQGEETIAYPLFLRSVSELPFVTNQVERWDTVSPEYTGPLAQKGLSPATAAGFYKYFTEYCRQERIVAEFAHLHPWNVLPNLLATEDVYLDREIIYVDLRLSETELWQNSFSKACRKNIKRAHRENVRVFQAETLGDIQEFYRIYIETMDRNQALTKYYFPLDYFVAFFQCLSDNARFVLAEYNNQIVAGTLYLYDDIDAYSYLGGANHAFQHVRPTNAVVYETIQWAQRKGKQRFILGGGYQPNDGIFRFKASFSPLSAKFYVYKHIHLIEEYAALCRAWQTYYQTDMMTNSYFPRYRSTSAE